MTNEGGEAGEVLNEVVKSLDRLSEETSSTRNHKGFVEFL